MYIYHVFHLFKKKNIHKKCASKENKQQNYPKTGTHWARDPTLGPSLKMLGVSPLPKRIGLLS